MNKNTLLGDSKSFAAPQNHENNQMSSASRPFIYSNGIELEPYRDQVSLSYVEDAEKELKNYIEVWPEPKIEKCWDLWRNPVACDET